MPAPLIVWGLIAGAGALGIGSYSAGRKVGESIGNSVPYVAGSIAVYMLYQAAKK